MNKSQTMPETIEEFLDALSRGPDYEPNIVRLSLLGVMEKCNRDGTEFVNTDFLEEKLSDYYELNERSDTVHSVMVHNGFSVEHIDYPGLCQYCGSDAAR